MTAGLFGPYGPMHRKALADLGAQGYCSVYCMHNRNHQCDCDPCTFLREQGGVTHKDDCPLKDAEGQQ